jgi:hypothetical protein
MSNSNTSGLNSKLVEHFNEMLSAENAGIDYLQTRIDMITSFFRMGQNYIPIICLILYLKTSFIILI